MTEELELYKNCKSFCTPDSHAKLLLAFEDRNLVKFEEILTNGLKEGNVNINYWYDDPHYGTLLDIICKTQNCSQFVKILLDHGINVNQINKIRKKGPIHFVVECSDIATLQVLLKCKRTDVNLLDNTGSTALHIASKLNKPTFVNVLLNHPSININLINRKGQTPLHVALISESEDVVRILCRRNSIDLDDAKSASGKTCRDLIIEKYPSLGMELSKKVTSPKRSGKDSLFNYLYCHDIDSFLKEAVKHKPSLDETDGHNTYLQYACNYGLCDAANGLLSLGVNPNGCCVTNSKPPVMIASYNGYVDIVDAFIKNDETSYAPVNGETIIHSIIEGLTFSQPSLSSNGQQTDHYKCLEEVLTKVSSDKLDINQQDIKGNTALHYAGKLGDHKVILLLLRHGAYVGQKNLLNEFAVTNIPRKTLEEYLDECVTTNDKKSREDNYEIIFKYKFLTPPMYVRDDNFPLEIDLERKQIQDDLVPNTACETAPLFEMSKVPELRPLLSHPVLTSFLNLKWYSIRRYFYINAFFYIAFWFLLTIYCLGIYGSSSYDVIFRNATGSDYPDPDYINKAHYALWLSVMILSFGLIIREIFQLSVAPWNYVKSLENWMELALIGITLIMLGCRQGCLNMRHQIAAIAILLSWAELVLLIGRHPLLSTNIEMFKTVSINFLKFLAWYSIMILAFALSFYLLFRDAATDDNFFQDPITSIFKSIVMLTGEFDASAIPFQQYPGTSHVLFVLFVFLIAIILFNLLNGLAVSDTQSIKANAELVGFVSRVKLISYAEAMASGDPFPCRGFFEKITCMCCCIPMVNKRKSAKRAKHIEAFYKRISMFPYLLPDSQVHVLPNQENKSILYNKNASKQNKRQDDNDTSACFDKCNTLYIDREIIKAAKTIIDKKNDCKPKIDHELIINYGNQLEEYKRKLELVQKTSEQNQTMLMEALALLKKRN